MDAFKAVKLDDVEFLESWLQSGGDPNMTESATKKNSSLLHWAAYLGSRDAVVKLISAGADVDALESDNKTPLHWAAFEGDGPIVTLLLGADADYLNTDERGNTPCDHALMNNHIEVAKLFPNFAEREKNNAVFQSALRDLALLGRATPSSSPPPPPPTSAQPPNEVASEPVATMATEEVAAEVVTGECPESPSPVSSDGESEGEPADAVPPQPDEECGGEGESSSSESTVDTATKVAYKKEEEALLDPVTDPNPLPKPSVPVLQSHAPLVQSASPDFLPYPQLSNTEPRETYLSNCPGLSALRRRAEASEDVSALSIAHGAEHTAEEDRLRRFAREQVRSERRAAKEAAKELRRMARQERKERRKEELRQQWLQEFAALGYARPHGDAASNSSRGAMDTASRGGTTISDNLPRVRWCPADQYSRYDSDYASSVGGVDGGHRVFARSRVAVPATRFPPDIVPRERSRSARRRGGSQDPDEKTPRSWRPPSGWGVH